MKKIIINILLFIGALIFGYSSCNAPQRKDFSVESCFWDARCRWDMQKEAKAVCIFYSELCKDDKKEVNSLNRIDICFKSWESWKFSSQDHCRSYINQK